MSISLIAVVMAGFTTFFVNSVAFTSQQRATQIATQIASSAVDRLRSLPTSDLINGRDMGSVVAQFRVAPDAVSNSLSSMLQTTADPNALPGSGATAAVPTVAVLQTVNSVVYSRNIYLGTCAILPGTTTNSSCQSTLLGTGNKYLQAVVAVTWTGGRCPPAGCTYVTSTLLSTGSDPAFNPNQAPPTPPTLTNPGPQVSVVGDTVSLPMTIVAAPSYSVALTAGTLPLGLFSPDAASGLITGKPSVVTPTTPVTLMLTDGFGRTTTATFTWTVVAPLIGSSTATQFGVRGTAITPLTVSASGGTSPYVWSDPGTTLPPGLSLSTVSNQARITGTPTTTGSYPVTLTVSDGKQSTTVAFTWGVYLPFSATSPGAQTSTVGVADTVALSVAGGSGAFAWTSTTLPAGLTVTPAGVVSGAPTAAGVTSVTLVATDTTTTIARSVTFNWTVYAPPTVGSPGNRSLTVGQAVSWPVGTTCPNTPCVYTLNNGPATIAISGTGLITGTITSAAQIFSAVTVTVTDSAGAAVTGASGAWTVNAAPTISNPGDQIIGRGQADTLDVAALVSGGTAPLTYSVVNLPSWLTLNASTGLITGTAPGTAGTTTGIVLTVRDSNGFSASSPAFSWIVTGPPSAPLAVNVSNGDTTANVTWTAPSTSNGAVVTGYTVTVSPGAGCTSTGALGCTLSGLTNGIPYSVTVTATNSFGTSPASTAVVAIPYPAGVMSSANGMTLWLDGADPSVMLGGSCLGAPTTTAVACWKDKSGQGNNFVQATSANRPGVGTWDGLPAANFADSGDVLSSVNAGAQYQTVFFAANVTNPAGSGVIVNLFGQAGQDYNARIGSLADRRTQSSQNANDWAYNTGNPPQNWANGAQGANAPQPLQVITTDQSNSIKTFTASVSNTYGGRGVIGQVGDVITFNKALSTAQRRSVEEYLANKWGVPITPAAPTSVSGARSSATSATVSWAAPGFNGGAPIAGYQVTASPGGRTCVTAGLSCAVTGLTTSTRYTFSVVASNSVGIGPASDPSNSVTP